MNTQTPFDKDVETMKLAAGSPAQFSFLHCIAKYLFEITSFTLSKGFKHTDDVIKVLKSEMFDDIWNVNIDDRLIGSEQTFNNLFNDILKSAFYYIDQIHDIENVKDSLTAVKNLNCKIYLLSFIPGSEFAATSWGKIKNKSHEFTPKEEAVFTDDIDWLDEYNQAALEALLIVCKCHYFGGYSNRHSKYSFWEYAAAWDIKPEWTKLIKKHYGNQLIPSDIVMQKGKTEIENWKN